MSNHLLHLNKLLFLVHMHLYQHLLSHHLQFLYLLQLCDKLDIDLTSISLYSGAALGGATTGALIGSDYTPNLFSFGSIAAGSYTLAVASTVSRDFGLWNADVGYIGVLATSRATVASPAPEPETYAMMLAGLVGIGAMVRRRKQG